MVSPIYGNTTATPNPQPDWNQTDSTKADYIKNKPVIPNLTELTARVEADEKALDDYKGEVEERLSEDETDIGQLKNYRLEMVEQISSLENTTEKIKNGLVAMLYRHDIETIDPERCGSPIVRFTLYDANPNSYAFESEWDDEELWYLTTLDDISFIPTIWTRASGKTSDIVDETQDVTEIRRCNDWIEFGIVGSFETMDYGVNNFGGCTDTVTPISLAILLNSNMN